MKRKITLVVLAFLSLPLLLSAQKVLEKKVKFSYENKALDMVLFDIEIAHQVKFEYQKADIKDVRIDQYVPKMALEEAMRQLLQGTGIQFQFKSPNIFQLSKKTFVKNPALTASKEQPTRTYFTLSGVIKDATTGETLPFSNVLVVGSSTGVSANVDGWFVLQDVPSDTVLVEVSYIGYRTQLFRLSPDMNLEEASFKLYTADHLLEAVTVTSTKKEQMMKASKGVSRMAIAPAQLSAIPSLGEKDVFRSLQLLPGVSGSNESSSGLFVRGGTPDQNLVLFDGFTVYHVDHLFGFFSAFNSNAIKDVQLFKGGFESKYGGRLSSVVDITGKDGNAEEFNVGGGISLLSVNGFLEMPFAKGKGTLILTGRRSFQSNFYNDILEFSDGDSENEEENSNAPPFRRRGQASVVPESWFYDFNGKLTYKTKKDVFSWSFYTGKDNLNNSRDANQNTFGSGPFGGGGLQQNFQLNIVDESDWGNTGTSAKWSRRWSDQLYSNALLSYSNYFSQRDRGTYLTIERDTSIIENNNGTTEDNNLNDCAFRWDWEWKPSLYHNIGFGVSVNYFDIKYDYIQNDTSTVLARDDQGILTAFYVQSQSTLFEKLIVSPSLRTSYFDQTSQLYWEPRLQVQYLLNDQIKLKAATGRFYQFANRIIREDIAQGSRDFWILSDGQNVPVGRSDHLILGTSYETNDYLFDIEGYYKVLDEITEYSTRFVLNGFGQGVSLDFEENFFNGDGIAKGVELLAQKKAGALTGWVSYTLGRVEHQFDIYGDDPFVASHDVTHELKIVGMYRLGNWSFGGTFIYATGRPYTPPLGAYTIELLDGSTTDHFAISEKNAFRLPDYHRLDLSVNYDFDYFLGGKATAGLSLFNLYNRSNIWYKEYEVVDGAILETDVNLLGFTPSLYFNWKLR